MFKGRGRTDAKQALLEALEEENLDAFAEAVQFGISEGNNWEHKYKERMGKTILQLSIEMDSAEYLKELLIPGSNVDVNDLNLDGLSAFHLLLLKLVELAKQVTHFADLRSSNLEETFERNMINVMDCMLVLLNHLDFDVHQLIAIKSNNRQMPSHDKLRKMTPLQIICSFQPWNSKPITENLHKKLEEVVNIILSKEIDPNATITGQPPVWLATMRGYFRIIEVFQNCKETNFLVQDRERSNILQAAIIGYLYKLEIHGSDGILNNIRTLQCLLSGGSNPKFRQQMQNIINDKDLLGNTALHFAQFCTEDVMVINMLLDYGAKLAKNKTGDLNITSETLEHILDSSIAYAGDDFDDEDFTIHINHSFFVSPKDYAKNKIFKKNDAESGKKTIWSSRTAVGTLDTEQLELIAEDESLRSLLKHPVITSLLEMQSNWASKTMILTDVIAYCFLVVVICIFYNWHFDSRPRDIYEGRYYYIVVSIACFCLAFALLKLLYDLWSLGLRRIYMFAIFRLIVIGLAVVNLIPGDTISLIAHRHISALNVVLVGIQLYILLVGLFPDKSAATHFQMYMKVLKMYTGILLSYWIFIFIFAFSFYTIFHQYPSDDNNALNDNSPCKVAEKDIYANFGTSLVKTFVAFAGEVGLSELNIAHWIGYVILVLFVYLVVIVLMNVLNGLAVADVSEFRQSVQKELLTKHETECIERLRPDERVYHDRIVIYPNITPEKKGFFWQSEEVYRIKVGRTTDIDNESLKDGFISKFIVRAAVDIVHKKIQKKYLDSVNRQEKSRAKSPSVDENNDQQLGLKITETKLEGLKKDIELKLADLEASLEVRQTDLDQRLMQLERNIKAQFDKLYNNLRDQV